MAHTKGPWKAKIHRIVDVDDNVICTVEGIFTNRDNAKLIASAPDLLEALIDARKAIASLDIDALGRVPDHPDYGYGWPIREELLSKIDYAIQKVRGP